MDEISAATSANDGGDARGALAAAVALLRRGLRADGTYEGIGEGEVAGYQWRALDHWALAHGLIWPAALGPNAEGGREHDLRLPEEGRWLKFTKPDQAGYAIHVVADSVLMLPATPLEYLQRWRWQNRLFGDDVVFEGICREANGLRLVISQRDFVGDAPDWDELEHFFTAKLGFGLLPIHELGGYDTQAYFHGRIGVFDVRPLNAVRTESGAIALIDVIPQFFNRAAASFFSRLAQ